MALTVESARLAVSVALGGDPPPEYSYTRLINGAGRSLETARRWEWLASRETQVSLVAGSPRVVLPADFKTQVVATEPGFGWLPVTWVSNANYQHRRDMQGGLAGGQPYFGTLRHEIDATGAALPVLLIYPEPSAAQTFNLLYDAQWPTVTDDDAVIPIPPFLEEFYCAWLREYALGIIEHDNAPLHVRLAGLKSSPMFVDACRSDALSTGGHVQRGLGAAESSPLWSPRSEHTGNLG